MARLVKSVSLGNLLSLSCLSVTKRSLFIIRHRSSPNTEQMQHKALFRATKTLAWVTAQIHPHTDVDKSVMLTVMRSHCHLDRVQGKCMWNGGSIGLACMLVRCLCTDVVLVKDMASCESSPSHQLCIPGFVYSSFPVASHFICICLSDLWCGVIPFDLLYLLPSIFHFCSQLA